MTTTTKTKTKKATAPEFIDGPLSILYSCRVRLTPEQRQVLKDGLQAFRELNTPTQANDSVIPGSTITVTTNTKVGQAIYSEYGLSDLIVNDLINARESIPLMLLIKLQRMLSVDVVDRKELEDKFQNYLNYILQ